jgi:two-component system, OmpR family, phosphate regulon sensor histidine kinase PhoR
MKSTSPKKLLLLIALGIALFVSFALALYIWAASESIQFNWLVASFLISFSSSFLLLFFVNIFVFKRVEQLLFTVKNFRSQSDKTIAKIESNNDIENLDLEILAWADDRKNEIERLKKLEVYRKEFLGNVSHELKTPVFNIQGYVLTLLDGGLEDASINRNYLMRAEKSVDRMITIIDDLEAISQLETGELQIEPERFDIIALAKDVVDAQELKATAKGIILTLPEDLKPIFVMADRFRIRQVIVNLIVNSVKYGKEYGETKICFYDTGENITVEIGDNGIGISSEHLPRLFERFYRVDKSRSRDQGGTGLGLAIVKHIIEAHNQTIRVNSTEDVGTTFLFTLKKG